MYFTSEVSSFSSSVTGINLNTNLTIYFENGNNTITLTTLNNVCAFAICLATLFGSDKLQLYLLVL